MTSPATADQRVSISLAKLPPLPLHPTNGPRHAATPFGDSAANAATSQSHGIPSQSHGIPSQSHGIPAGAGSLRIRPFDASVGLQTIAKPSAEKPEMQTGEQTAVAQTDEQRGDLQGSPDAETSSLPNMVLKQGAGVQEAPQASTPAESALHPTANLGTSVNLGSPPPVATAPVAPSTVETAPVEPAPVETELAAGLAITRSTLPAPAAAPQRSQQNALTMPKQDAAPAEQSASSIVLLPRPQVEVERQSENESSQQPPAKIVVLPPMIQKVLPLPARERPEPDAPAELEPETSSDPIFFSLSDQPEPSVPNESLAPRQKEDEGVAKNESSADAIQDLPRLADVDAKLQNESESPVQTKSESAGPTNHPLAVADASEPTLKSMPQSASSSAPTARRNRQPRLAQLPVRQPLLVAPPPVVQPTQELPTAEVAAPKQQVAEQRVAEQHGVAKTEDSNIESKVASRDRGMASLFAKSQSPSQGKSRTGHSLLPDRASNEASDDDKRPAKLSAPVATAPVIAPVLIDPILVDPVQQEATEASSDDAEANHPADVVAGTIASATPSLNYQDVNLEDAIAATTTEQAPSQAAEANEVLEDSSDRATPSLHTQRYRPPVAVSTVPIDLRGEDNDHQDGSQVPTTKVKSVAQVDLTPSKPKSILDPNIKLTPLFMKSAQVRSLTVAGELRDVRVADTSVCQAVVAGPNQLKLIGAGNGVTQLVVWAETSDPNRPMRMRAFEVHVDRIDPDVAAGGRTANLLKESIRNAFPNCHVVLSPEGGELIVSGRCDSRESAERIIRMVRKTCLVPVQDRLIVQ